MNKERLDPAVFDLPVHEIRRGYRSAVYFWRTKTILEKDNNHTPALMQVFQKNKAVLCGIDEAIAILKVGTGHYTDSDIAFKTFDDYIDLKKRIRLAHFERAPNYLDLVRKQIDIEKALDDLWVLTFDKLDVGALHDGEEIQPWETVMTIAGDYSQFSHLQSVYLGVLARRTLIATNVRKVVEAANNKPILFFADRFDHFAAQGGDGYAAKIGGAQGVATDAMAEWWGAYGLGTMPHDLIAIHHGDTVKAVEKFKEHYTDINPEIKLIALVDFQNDCVSTSLEVARKFGKDLWGVRLDTSETEVDCSLIKNNQLGRVKPTGVNPILVDNVRQALNQEGFNDVKIIVSGGFNAEKINFFEESKAPVDAYGCGSSLLKGNSDFTADIVMVEGRPCAKIGRWYQPNSKLEKVI